MLPRLESTFQDARVETDADRLVVSTGRMRRVWQWTGQGFATRELTDLRSGQNWTDEGSAACDWELPDATTPGQAELKHLSASVQDDEGFTSQHLCVEALITYPDTSMQLRFTIWAYPQSCGLRTQVSALRTGEAPAPGNQQGGPLDARIERIPVSDLNARRRFFGYYNHTQVRNDTHQNILKEDVIAHPLAGREWCNWASAACLETDTGGIALVKESHKCVNQGGHAGGGFVCDDSTGLHCSGWGLRAGELNGADFTEGWASWCIVWTGGDFERALAFKAFDHMRYPIDPERDIYIQANTWGSTDNGQDARRAAGQDSVLKEIEVCAELGIDVLQIDDGWQVAPKNPSWQPGGNGWHPHPETHPGGWATVREKATACGVKLGLWAAAQPVSLEALKSNFTDGGFLQYKLDFASLKSRADIDALMHKVRAFIAWTGHRVRVNWDVTENPPRYGYFFAREYGSIYLENRKPERPLSVIYRPHTVLRDLWQVAKYLNLHRFQCSIQNVDRVDPAFSDAHQHSHAYATAIALMGIPLFFQETKYYSDAAKAEISELLAVYKAQRESIYRGIVHPIGARPDNASWTGFQSHLADEQRGYLTVFRERCNAVATQSIELGWLRDTTIRVSDLRTGQSDNLSVSSAGSVELSIPKAPGFLFLQYEVVV